MMPHNRPLTLEEMHAIPNGTPFGMRIRGKTHDALVFASKHNLWFQAKIPLLFRHPDFIHVLMIKMPLRPKQDGVSRLELKEAVADYRRTHNGTELPEFDHI